MRSISVSVVLTLALSSSPTALALTLTPLEDIRTVSGESFVCDPSGFFCSRVSESETWGSLGETFEGSAGPASQHTDVTASHVGGGGSAIGFEFLPGRSSFLLGFSLDEDAAYTFTGSLSHEITVPTRVGLCLDRDCASPVHFEELAVGTGDNIRYFDYSGILPAGEYWLAAFAETDGYASATFYFDFDVTPVPEPGAALLALLGLGTLCARARAALG